MGMPYIYIINCNTFYLLKKYIAYICDVTISSLYNIVNVLVIKKV